LVVIFKFLEAAMLSVAVGVGVVATGTALITGESPELIDYVQMIAPPYESDDKRIYPDIWEEEDAVPRNPYKK
tara:strand:- start:554 stop:772 length:219 start_codon:yes stop_codon:yes gene_type:complete